MHVKIQVSELKEGNKGSCSDYANYLEKENEYKPEHEKEYFFSHDREQVGVFEVVELIDKNKGQIKSHQDKFFSITLSPSTAELKHIGEDNTKLKDFTRLAMNEYAKNFDKGINGNDLLYFAKLETERRWKGKDDEVKNGRVKSGELKRGDNRHIHVIVSRKTKDGYKKISPMYESKGHTQKIFGTEKEATMGFDRQKFSHAVENVFDFKMNYRRRLEETYQYKLEQRKLPTSEKVEQMLSRLKTPILEKETPGQKVVQEQEEKKQQDNQKGMGF